VKAHTVVAEFDGLGWSKPQAMRRFFLEQRENLGVLADGGGRAGLEGLLAGQSGGPKQGKRLCDLVSCVVGDPFRPLPPLQAAILAWNNGVIARLAARIHEERDFTRGSMGVLADALEEAGMDDQDVLEHLRGPGLHSRGCHVLDWLLGRG
jgi:hypothetical protein